MNNYIREPINGLTHLVGAILSLIALVAMVFKVVTENYTLTGLISVIIFGLSMLLLYATSATYHMIISSDPVINFLQRLDHSMIFVLIAGSYTPFCLMVLNGKSGWILFSIVSIIAICGIIFKLAWFNCSRVLSTFIYILMGWLVIFAFEPLLLALSTNSVMLLVLGGVLYTIGGILYAIKPDWQLFKYLGYHEVFHIFILLGSLSHFLCIYFYVL